jgi:4'-phosphopantetheinyl transferase
VSRLEEPAARVGIGAGTCEVWMATTDGLRPRHLELLHEQERARAARYRHREDRDRSLLAAALLRLVAARLLSGGDTPDPCLVRDLRVRRKCGVCGGPHGKPSVGSGLHVSLSHTGATVVVAATEVARVGVDVEPRGRPSHAGSGARTACSSAEWALVHDGRDALRYWTRKEAVAKATGEGLSAPLADISVSGPREQPELRGWRGRSAPPCTLLDLDEPSGFVGALAVLTTQPFRLDLRDGDQLLAAA